MLDQPRDHAVQCSRCGVLTFNSSALCDKHQEHAAWFKTGSGVSLSDVHTETCNCLIGTDHYR